MDQPSPWKLKGTIVIAVILVVLLAMGLQVYLRVRRQLIRGECRSSLKSLASARVIYESQVGGISTDDTGSEWFLVRGEADPSCVARGNPGAAHYYLPPVVSGTRLSS